jgi:oligoendopeptidase F
MAKSVVTRSDVPQEQRWNADSVFTSPQAWHEAAQAFQAQLEDLGAFKGTLAQGPGRLLDWFALRERLAEQLGKLSVYAVMSYSVDTKDETAVAQYDQVRALSARFGAAVAFAEPELLALGFDTLRTWMQTESRLAVYEHVFERLEHRAAHLRSAEVEELLGAVADPFATATAAHGVLANTDLVFRPAQDSSGEEHEITQGNIGTLLKSPDRSLRRSAWEHYADAHLGMQNTMANILSAGVKQNNFMASARRYGSALEASLAPESIPLEVFHSLIGTFKSKLPIWHRYWRARRQALGYETLHTYDIFAPITHNPPTIPYAQSVQWLTEALKALGQEYVTVLKRGALEERWVDRSVNRGKRMGAFSYGVQGTHPFIMMSYADDVFGMSTLAHEFGHSMHSYFTWQTQPPAYSRYSLFVAEVASNFNQAVLRDYLFRQNTDRDFRLALIDEAMSNFHRYFFIMPTLARFELEIHERSARGEALGARALTDLMAELFAEGYGAEVALDRPREGITWAEFHTHLYSRFYVYQYATGIAGAHALAKGILEGQAGAAERYLDFLRAGGSKYPLDALKDAGVDLRTPAPVEEAFNTLELWVERLETLSQG